MGSYSKLVVASVLPFFVLGVYVAVAQEVVHPPTWKGFKDSRCVTLPDNKECFTSGDAWCLRNEAETGQCTTAPDGCNGCQSNNVLPDHVCVVWYTHRCKDSGMAVSCDAGALRYKGQCRDDHPWYPGECRCFDRIMGDWCGENYVFPCDPSVND